MKNQTTKSTQKPSSFFKYTVLFFLFIIFLTHELIAMFVVIVIPSFSHDQVSILHDRSLYHTPFNQNGYWEGKKLDLNGDGKQDYISIYGCAMISGEVTHSSVPSCSLPEADASTQTVFPQNSSGLSVSDVTTFSSYKGQQYAKSERIGTFFGSPSPIYTPLSFLIYQESVEGKTNFVIEHSSFEVNRYEVDKDGSFVEKSPTFTQRMRAVFNTHTHKSKDLWDASIIMAFIGVIALFVVSLGTGIYLVVKEKSTKQV